MLEFYPCCWTIAGGRQAVPRVSSKLFRFILSYSILRFADMLFAPRTPKSREPMIHDALCMRQEAVKVAGEHQSPSMNMLTRNRGDTRYNSTDW